MALRQMSKQFATSLGLRAQLQQAAPLALSQCGRAFASGGLLLIECGLVCVCVSIQHQRES